MKWELSRHYLFLELSGAFIIFKENSTNCGREGGEQCLAGILQRLCNAGAAAAAVAAASFSFVPFASASISARTSALTCSVTSLRTWIIISALVCSPAWPCLDA